MPILQKLPKSYKNCSKEGSYPRERKRENRPFPQPVRFLSLFLKVKYPTLQPTQILLLSMPTSYPHWNNGFITHQNYNKIRKKKVLLFIQENITMPFQILNSISAGIWSPFRLVSFEDKLTYETCSCKHQLNKKGNAYTILFPWNSPDFLLFLQSKEILGLQVIVPTHLGRKARRKVPLSFFRGANTPTQYSALYLAAQRPQPAELSQHRVGPGGGTSCHSTAFSSGLRSLKALYAVLQSLHVYFFAASVNPPGIQVPD